MNIMQVSQILTLLLSLGAPTILSGAPIKVFGHQAPDTDTTCSAIIYAWELNARNIPATPYILGDLNPETAYVLKAIGAELPALLEGKIEPKTKVAIVDTNNPGELPEGIEKATIHSIVDHHKLSGLSNAEPLEIDMRPLCSAASILYARAKAYGLTVPKDVAGCMLSGLLSDSLVFRSPTTTEMDKVYAAELGKIAGLDVNAHGDKMLEAKAQIDHLTPDELVMMDTKVFKLSPGKVRVSVLETTKPAAPLAKKAALVEAQQKKIKEEGIDDMLLFVVDIINEAATFVSCSPTATKLVEKAWKVKVGEDGLVVLPGVLSRKKQMIPALEAVKKDEL
jgi:manganese-dependent inorganic pyrophosphatase